MNDYLEAAKLVYEEAANNPQKGLCCTTTPVWQLPELTVPSKMLEMNYGCGSTVNPRDLSNDPTVLYVGVGGGMVLLQFAYFCRRPGAVIGLDPVGRMLEVCADKTALAYLTASMPFTLGKRNSLTTKRATPYCTTNPLAVCDKTAAALESLGRNDILTTPSTYFYDGGGCC